MPPPATLRPFAWLLATGFKDLYETHPGGWVDDSAWLYQRQSNGSWYAARAAYGNNAGTSA